MRSPLLNARIRTRDLSFSTNYHLCIYFTHSTAGHFAESIVKPFSLYCASKYAVTGMTHSLRNELAAANIDVKITVYEFFYTKLFNIIDLALLKKISNLNYFSNDSIYTKLMINLYLDCTIFLTISVLICTYQ